MQAVTVSDLIEQLEKLPADLQVVIAQDEEGNGFSPHVEASNERDQCVILWPGYMDDLSEVVDNYVEEDEDEESED